MAQYGVDPYQAEAAAGDGNGWYGESATAAATEVPIEQGQTIPTMGGGPVRPGRGASRFNPMARKRGGSMANAYVPPSSAQKNEYGFVIFAYLGVDTDEGALHGLFSPFGTVAKVDVIHGKGFGFVTMPDQTEAEAAINALNGGDYQGNRMQIRFKTPKGANPVGRGAPRGGDFRGGRPSRGGPRGRGRGGPRGGYHQPPAAAPYGGGYAGGYDGYGYPAAPAPAYGYEEYADPYAYSAAGGYPGYESAAAGW